MKRYARIILTLYIALLPLAGGARESYSYSSERPLTIVCDWDFQPFEYVNSSGRPAGYNIDVLTLIFQRLDIPYRFVMREWQDAARTFERHEADLIHAMAYRYRGHSTASTKKFVNYYTLCAVRRQSTPQLQRLMHLDSTRTVVFKKDDYAALTIEAMDTVPFRMAYSSIRDALMGVSQGRYDYFIWGEEPLKRKMKELAIDSLVTDEVDIPAGELRIMGYDREIVDLIDDEFTRLEQAGEIQKIYEKWFHPERQHDDASPVTLAIVLVTAVALLGVCLLGWLIYLRVRVAVRRNTDLNNMMTQALRMGDYYVLEYDIESGHVRNAYGNLLPEGGMSQEQFLSRFPAGEVGDFKFQLERLQRGEVDEWTLRKHWNVGTEGRPVWNEYYGSAILEREKGVPRYIFHTFKDVTRETQEEQRNQELTALYQKAFQTNLAAMSFYDAEGRLIDLNDKMRQLLELTPEGEEYFRQTNLYDDEYAKSFIGQDSNEVFHICGRMQYPELGLDKYIESRVRPVFDDEGNRVFYIVAARDVTAERDLYMQQREHDRRLQQSNAQITAYEEQLHYLLEQSKMFAWRLDMQTGQLVFSRTLRDAEYTETLDEYFQSICEHERDEARRMMTDIVMQGQPLNVIHEFDYTPVGRERAWHSIVGIPLRDADGHIIQYFGLLRNVTELMLAQERLRQETARAEDSGRLKSAFLANMTHEIRTPLNAIVGFSDVLQMIDDKDERMELIRIIRSNCDMLLRLINDILEASSMGQSLVVEPQEVDVPKVFNDICQTLAQRVEEVSFIKDNPCDTYVATLDKGRLQQLLTNFVTNAVKYTHEGHIRIGWRPEERDGVSGLYFYCEDTGAGIPRDKQAAVFDRFVKLNDFVQGTGLGLSICKAIVERCGGHIGVTSDGEGKGSTFWFWQPRILHVSNEEQGE